MAAIAPSSEMGMVSNGTRAVRNDPHQCNDDEAYEENCFTQRDENLL